MFVVKTNHTVNLSEVKEYVNEILTYRPWPDGSIAEKQILNQIGLNYRPGVEHTWLDAPGSLIDPVTGVCRGTEYDFTEWNKQVPAPLVKIIKDLAEAEGFQIGRVRLMKLVPKSGLTVHYDKETRFHLVLETNPFSYIATTTNEHGYDAVCQHIPADGHFYHIDTTLEHFVYNGGRTERIHLVICAL